MKNRGVWGPGGGFRKAAGAGVGQGRGPLNRAGREAGHLAALALSPGPALEQGRVLPSGTGSGVSVCSAPAAGQFALSAAATGSGGRDVTTIEEP